MPRKCFVSFCRSVEGRASLFSVPKDPEMRHKWQEALPKRDRPLDPKDKVCIIHFCKDDLLGNTSIHINNTTHVFERNKPRLKPGAIPTVFSRHDKSMLPLSNIYSEPCFEWIKVESSEQSLAITDVIQHASCITMPSSLWGYHCNERMIAFSCFSEDHFDKGHFCEKGVVLEESMIPEVNIRGRNMKLNNSSSLHIQEIKSISDLEFLLKKIDEARLCTGYETQSLKLDSYGQVILYSPTCKGLVHKSQFIRCKNCSIIPVESRREKNMQEIRHKLKIRSQALRRIKRKIENNCEGFTEEAVQEALEQVDIDTTRQQAVIAFLTCTSRKDLEKNVTFSNSSIHKVS